MSVVSKTSRKGESVTKNEIDFRSVLETERHNRVTEAETERSNRVVEQETNRHNIAYETETNRHNVITENETMRNHIAVETETYRSNVARETETHRANVAQEVLSAQRNAIAAQSNAIQARQVEYNYTLGLRQAELTENRDLLNYEVASRNASAQESQAASAAKRADTEAMESPYNMMAQDARTRNLQADTELKQAQTDSERVLLNGKVFNNYSSGVSSVLGVLSKASDLITR